MSGVAEYSRDLAEAMTFDDLPPEYHPWLLAGYHPSCK